MTEFMDFAQEYIRGTMIDIDIGHKYIVYIGNADINHPKEFLAIEVVNGKSVLSGEMPAEIAWTIMRQVPSSVSFAHSEYPHLDFCMGFIAASVIYCIILIGRWRYCR